MRPSSQSVDKESLLRLVHAQLGKVRRRRANREADLKDAQLAECYRNMGELILANRAQAKRGANEITVANWFQGGDKLTIPLQPDLGPVENAARYFKQWKKARKAAEVVPLLLRSDAREEELLVGLQARVEAAETSEEIAALAEELTGRGYRTQKGPVSSPRTAEVPRRPKGIRVYEDFVGFRILVGTGAQGNERLLRELSSPDDIWLHTRGARGAHAIVKTNRHPERVSPQVIEKVAALTAHFSDERGAATVAVDYTLRKYVRKAKGGRPGLVTYERGKTVFVAPLSRPPHGLSPLSPIQAPTPPGRAD